MRDGTVVGQSLSKIDGYDKVSGRAQYVNDLWRPNMLYGKAVRSDFAHALIKEIDINAALTICGVEAVITASDIPGINQIGVTGFKDQRVLAEDRVRFYGEAIAAVAASTPEIAAEACGKVKIVYEKLPTVSTPEGALSPTAPLVGEETNICLYRKIVKGKGEKGLEDAEVAVHGEYRTSPVEHSYLEPEAVLAEPEGEGLTIWSTTKGAHLDQREIARVLGWPLDRIRVVAMTSGGSFGGKPDLPINCMAALLAVKTGLPVKMVYSREESFQVSTKRHSCIFKYTHGAKRDGTLVYVKLDVLADVGAYTDYSSLVLPRIAIHGTGPYRVPHAFIEIRGLLTNNPVAGAMRGFGVPQVAFACERQMDRLAKVLGMDAFELRLKNALVDGDTTATGQIITGVPMRMILEKAKELVGSEGNGNPSKHSANAFEREAWGIGCSYYGYAGVGEGGFPGVVRMRVTADGLIRMEIGAPDIGQGSNTIFTQIAAEVLGIDPQHIILVSADTRYTLDCGTTAGTRLTVVVGNAVKNAAAELKKKIIICAGELCVVEPNRLRMVSRQPCIELFDGDGSVLSLRDLFREFGEDLEVVGQYAPPPGIPLDENGQGSPYAFHTFGVQCAKVLVNILTGKVTVQKIVAIYDVGTPINPALVLVQMEGGIAMGIGYALTEEIQLKDGRVLNPNFDLYMIPTSMDIATVQFVNVPLADEAFPFGAKGIGEPSCIPTAAAIANAVAEAAGVDFFRLPINLEEVISGVTKRG